MNKALFAAAVSSIALVSTAAHADTTKFDASVGLAIGVNASSLWADTTKAGPAVDLSGSVALPIKGTNLGLQGDLDVNLTNYPNYAGYGEGAQNTVQSTVAIHAFDRTDKGLVGLVLQATNSNPHNGYYDYYVSRDTRFYTGVEAQRYLDKVTLSGRAAYFFGIGSNQQDQNTQNSTGYNLALSAKYFRTANTSFALEGGFEGAISNIDGSRSVHHAWLVGGKAEHRLSAYPVSVNAEVTYRQGKYEGESSRDHDLRALVGFKVNFGSKTLLERDRNGASLETVKSLAASDNGYNDY